MAGWEDVKAIQQEIGNGDHFGSAFAENEQYVDSLSGKLNALKEVWVGIFQTVFNDSSIKGMLDGLIAVSEVIADIVSALDQFGMAGPTAMMGLFGGFKMLKSLAGKGTGSFIGNMVGEMFDLERATSKTDKSVKQTTKSSGLLGKVWDIAFGAKAISGTKATAEGVETVAKASKLSATGLKQMAKGFVANMSVGLKFGLIGTAVMGTVGAIDYMNKALDRQYSKLKESITGQENEIKQIQDKKTALQSIQEEYDALSNNSNRTSEETARLLELTKQIAEIMPELVSGYDAEGNPILNMKGDVSDLISEMERGIETKKRLLIGEKRDLAENALSQLGGVNISGSGNHITTSANGHLEELSKIETKYNKELEKLYSQRDKLESKMVNATGARKEELLRQLQDHDRKIITHQEKSNSEYLSKLDEIKQYSSDIGDYLFSSIESGYAFDGYSEELQGQIMGLKEILDFSDINTEEELYATQHALKQLAQAASLGKIDLGSLKDSLNSANAEFARTGDVEAYNRSIGALVDKVHSATGIDKNLLTEIFTGLPPALNEASTSLDGFMKKFGKSTLDLQNSSDKIAKAVKNQFDAIQRAIESIQITGEADIDYKTAINLTTDQDLPTEVRDMVRTLLNKNYDPSEVLSVAQKLLVDMSDGEVDLETFQAMLDKTFGEGAYEVSPNLFINSEVETAQIETTLEKVKNTFGEVPVEIETLVKANSLTAEADVNRVMAMYELCPDEVITLIETQGNEQAYNTITELMNQYNRVPLDIKTELKNNGVESVSKIVELNNIYESLPEEVQTYIKANNYEALLNASTIEEVLANIPEEKLIDILTKTEGKQDVEAIKGIIDKLPPEVKTRVEAEGMAAIEAIAVVKENLDTMPKEVNTKVTTDMSDAENKLSIWDRLFGQKKTQELKVKATADTGDAENKLNSLSNKKLPDKNVKIKGDSKDVDSKVNSISKKKIKDKDVKIKGNSRDADNKISAVDKKKLKDKTTNLKGVDNASSVINTINNKTLKDKSATYTITTKYKTVGSPGPAPSGATPGSISADAIQSNTLAIQRSVQDGMGAIDSFNSNANLIVRTPTLENTPMARGWGNSLETHKYGLNQFIELENQLKKLANQLSVVEEKMKNAFGQEKINYLNQQNNLLKQQQALQSQLSSEMEKQQQALKSFLSGKGFGFDGDGNITNYHTKLVAMNRELERLEENSKKASDASSNYKGDNEGEKDRLSNASKSASEALSKYKESYDEIKKAMDSYLDLTFSDIPKAKEEWEKLQNEIKETNDAIEELNRNQKLFAHQNKVKELEYEYDRLADKLDILDIKLNNAYGKDKLKLMDQQIELLEKQKKVQSELADSYKQQASIFQSDLSKLGFEFNAEGDFTNLDETLNKFKDHKDLEKVKKLVEEYIKIQRDELPDAIKEWEKLENEIKDTYKEQLKITKEIEDKITEVYKKQVEERKKLIDEELKKRLDALDKEKKAYNDSRKEADYKRDYEDQMDVISKLQEDIDNASKDDSLSGKKKLEQLLKQLQDEQRKLEDLVQDKLDDQVNDMFDKESDRLESEAEAEKDRLDDKFSDDKLQQIVKDALTNGVFVDIDGNIKDLEKTLLEFEDKFGDGMTAIGDVLKNELIANLNIAKDSMKDLTKILDELDLTKYSSDIIGVKSIGRNMNPYSQNTSNANIQFNSPLIVVEGNVDKDMIPVMEDMIEKAKDDIVNDIVSNIR